MDYAGGRYKFAWVRVGVFVSRRSFWNTWLFRSAGCVRTGIASRNAIKNALMQLKDFQGVTGLTSFNDKGDVKKELSLLRIKDDKFVELEFNR